MNTQDSVILLTACVNPCGMSSTKLQDTTIRLEQYKQALSFYLSETSYKILFVENTGYDFGNDFSAHINNGRLEYLTFSGNNYDLSLGKGYGEAQIISYAINNSHFLKKASVIIKITGRIIVENVVDLCSGVNIPDTKNVMIACNIRPSKKIGTSTFFVCKKEFLTNYFLPHIQEINETDHIWFEHILYESIIQCKKEKKKILIFPKPIKIQGIAGTTSLPYPKTKRIDYILSYFAAFLHNHFGYMKF
jgi:hypothetical protein